MRSRTASQTGPHTDGALGSPGLQLVGDEATSVTSRRLSPLFRAVMAIAKAPLSASEKSLLLALLSFTNFDTGESWPSLKSLAERAGMSRRALVNNLKNVTKRGFVVVQKRSSHTGSWDSNHYHLNVDELERSTLPSASNALPPSAFSAPGVVHQLHQGGALGAHDRDQLTGPPEQENARPSDRAEYKPRRRRSRHGPLFDQAPPHNGPSASGKAGVPPEQSSSARAWSDYWCSEWQALHSAKYRFGQKDGVALAAIRDHLDDDFRAFKHVVARYLADAEEFTAVKNAHSLTFLNSQLNKYLAQPPADAEDSPRTPTPDEIACMFGSPQLQDGTTA